MVLDSVYPPRFNGFDTTLENGLDGIQQLLDRCRFDASCNEDYPMLDGQLASALNLLSESPLFITVPNIYTADEVKRPMMLTAYRLMLMLDYASYDSDILGHAPAAINAAWTGDTDDESLKVLASNYLDIELFEGFSEPVFLTTECRENRLPDADWLHHRLKDYKTLYPMLDWSDQALVNPEMCRFWKTASSAPQRDFRSPVITDIPTLTLSGQLDSITPATWGRVLAKQLANGRYLEYPDAGHSVLTSSLCANDEVQLFLNPGLTETAFCDRQERLEQRIQSAIDWEY